MFNIKVLDFLYKKQYSKGMNKETRKTPRTVPVTKEQRELFDGDTIASQLPVFFKSTGFTLADFGGQCAFCQKPISQRNLRGRVDTYFPEVATIRAVGACPACRVLTPFSARARSDQSVDHLTECGWVRQYPNRDGWIKSAFRRVGAAFFQRTKKALKFFGLGGGR